MKELWVVSGGGSAVSTFVVREVWEAVTDRRLSEEQRRQFYERVETAELAKYGRRELEQAGRRALRTVPGMGSVLRLNEWLATLEDGGTTAEQHRSRVGGVEELFAADLLGAMIPKDLRAVAVRDGRVVQEVLKYSRHAIKRASQLLPSGMRHEYLFRRLLTILRNEERLAGQVGYDPLDGRSNRFDHRPKDPPAGRTW